jgi:hypothetical protein
VPIIHARFLISKNAICVKKNAERESKKDEGKRDENMFGAE